MSYEGLREMLCHLGHYDTCDAYSDLDRAPCRACGGPIVERHEIDQTNGTGERWALEVEVPARTETCHACGAMRTIEPARYKLVPKVEEITDD